MTAFFVRASSGIARSHRGASDYIPKLVRYQDTTATSGSKVDIYVVGFYLTYSELPNCGLIMAPRLAVGTTSKVYELTSSLSGLRPQKYRNRPRSWASWMSAVGRKRRFIQP